MGRSSTKKGWVIIRVVGSRSNPVESIFLAAKEAVKKAEHIHRNGTLEGGGRDAHTFEHYSEENYQVNFNTYQSGTTGSVIYDSTTQDEYDPEIDSNLNILF